MAARTLRALFPAAVIASLLLAVAVAFAPVLDAGFLSFDDPDYVTDNPRVRAGLTLDGLRWAFAFQSYNWHPLTWMSHMLDVRLFGLDPRGHHLVNLLLHLSGTLILLLVLRSVTGATAAAAFTAALFALHPLHVESVAWVSERKDVLSGLFWFLTMALYVRYLRKPGTGRYLAMLLAFACGLAAKPMLVSLPFILLLLDWWPLGRFGSSLRGRNAAGILGLIMEKMPLLLLAAAASAITYTAQASGGALNLWAEGSRLLRLSNALVSCSRYLAKMFWPSGLAVYYPLPASPPLAPAILSLLLLVGVTIAAIAGRHRAPWAVTGWFWYLVSLAPVVGLVQVGAQAMADRYTYLPLVGLFLAASWSPVSWSAGSAPRRLAVAAPAVALVLLLACLSQRQARFWKNDLTLFGHAVEVTRDNWMAQSVLAYALLEEGRLAEAAARYREALRLNPGYAQAHHNLGYALAAMGDFEGAAQHYRSAVGLRPDFPEAWFNLGLALQALGRRDEAEGAFARGRSPRRALPGR